MDICKIAVILGDDCIVSHSKTPSTANAGHYGTTGRPSESAARHAFPAGNDTGAEDEPVYGRSDQGIHRGELLFW
jgi:hypothetical protein